MSCWVLGALALVLSPQVCSLPARPHWTPSSTSADALENYTQVKAVYQALEPNQPWL